MEARVDSGVRGLAGEEQRSADGRAERVPVAITRTEAGVRIRAAHIRLVGPVSDLRPSEDRRCWFWVLGRAYGQRLWGLGRVAFECA